MKAPAKVAKVGSDTRAQARARARDFYETQQTQRRHTRAQTRAGAGQLTLLRISKRKKRETAFPQHGTAARM
jgi:hypothetical protein